MPLITNRAPATWQELETLVTGILSECGMDARRQVPLTLRDGSTVDIDVLATDMMEGIRHTIVCECKNWRGNVPQEKVHAFRTVMVESGANRGYIISRTGFQKGAIAAARATNIELITFEQLQEAYFEKWINKRLWAIEREIGNFNTYYEPLGQPGYSKLKNDQERKDYDNIWNAYAFAGYMLMPFSPYMRIVGKQSYPTLPFDVSDLEKKHIAVPADVKAATGYRELLELLTNCAREGLVKLRAVNPNTRGKKPEDIEGHE